MSVVYKKKRVRRFPPIDLVIILDLVISTHSVTIDEQKLDSLYYHQSLEGNSSRVVYPDHNAMIIQIDWKLLIKGEREDKTYEVIRKEGYKK